MTFATDFPDLWSETELRPYLGEVKRRHGIVETLALPSMRDLPPVQIETLFVPPLLAQTTVSADSSPEAWPSGRNLLTELQEFRQLVVLGDPGGGKTTLSNWLAWRLAAGLNAPLPDALKNRVPIPCVLRDMPLELFTSDVDLVDLVSSVVDNLLGGRPTAQIKSALLKRIYSGGYVLILDGVDEIPLAHRAVVSRWIREAFLQGACTLATSRIVGYEDYPVDCYVSPSSHVARSVGKISEEEVRFSFENTITISSKHHSEFYAAKSLDGRELERWAHVRYLMPFDQGRIASFAENWYRQRCVTEQEASQKTVDLLAALSKSEVTQKLARTPNLLSLMAIVHRERAHLPDGKALLYEEIANAYINTIDKQRKIEPGDVLAQYGWNDRKAWLAYVGFKMQETRNRRTERDAGILVDESDVVQWLTDAMIVSGVPEPVEAAKTFLYWVARRSGLLLPRGEARYAFVHLSFQEYFCACYLDSCIVRLSFIRNKLQPDADVTKQKLKGWSYEAHWLETLVFLFELLSSERDQEWVDDLAHIIFGEKVVYTPSFGGVSDLAARVIKNKHIKISNELRDDLAVSLGTKAIGEWEGERFGTEPEVLFSLLDTGYAVSVCRNSKSEKIVGSQALLLKSVESLGEVTSPEKVRVLILESMLLSDMKFLQKFVNVRFLRIKNLKQEESSFLGMFSELKLLHLINVSLRDIDPVEGLVSIKNLKIHGVPFSDLSPISKLNSLEFFELHGVKVLDLTPISNLKELSFLSINDVRAKDLNPLGELKKLNTLLLERIPESDFSSLAKLKKLDYLRIANTPVLDLKFCVGLKKLATLYFMDLNITDFSAISSLKWLDSLYIFRCKISSYEYFQELTGLSSIGLLDMPTKEIGFLNNMKNLSYCYFSGSEIEDLAPISSLDKLVSLSISQYSIKDVCPLVECKELRFIDIATQTTIDVGPLSKLDKLRSITIKSPEIRNLDLLEAVEGVRIDIES